MSKVELGTFVTKDGTEIRATMEDGIAPWREKREMPTVHFRATYREDRMDSIRILAGSFRLTANPPDSVIEEAISAITENRYNIRVAKGDDHHFAPVPYTYVRNPDIRHRAGEWAAARFIEAIPMAMKLPEVQAAHRDLVADRLPDIERDVQAQIKRVVDLRTYLESAS